MIPSLSFTIGFFKITPLFWSFILAGIISSFSLWRKLREDYKESVIFNLTLLSFFLGLLLGRLVFVLFHFSEFGLSLNNFFTLDLGDNFSLFGIILGVILAVKWMTSGEKGNLWEVLDALVLPLFYFLLLGGFGYFLKNKEWFSLGYTFTGILGISLSSLVANKYRSFPWYKSGKIGFLFTFFSLISSLALFLLAFFKNDTLYLYRFGWLLMAVASGAALYHRSGRNIKEDWRNFFKRK